MADSVKGNLKLAGFSLFAILVLIVIIQNTEPVETKVLLWNFTLPRALLLLSACGIGFFGGYLFAFLRGRKRPSLGQSPTPTSEPTVESEPAPEPADHDEQPTQ
tara:strand:+ start:618 stop:929 length:312 start_codon:yes stop_codon:yes gene_type:complete